MHGISENRREEGQVQTIYMYVPRESGMLKIDVHAESQIKNFR